MSPSTTSAPRIAILGAGPGGLCLAAILQRHGVHADVYEGEQSSTGRDQGGTLDLHEGTGQAALDDAGLLPAFHARSRPEGEAMKVVQADGTILWDDSAASAANPAPPTPSRGRPEIDRSALRELLLSAVSASSIHWGHKVVGVHAGPATATLEFASPSHEPSTPYDLVVGADGAWSRARAVVTPVRPEYSGISLVELWATNVHAEHAWLDHYTGAGSVFMFDDGRAIMAQRQGSGDVRVYAGLRVPETWQHECGIDWSQPGPARETLISTYFSDVGDDLKKVVREVSDTMVVRSLYHLPLDHTWTAHPTVTLLGDAAHLMTPFAGVGVNMALADARELADHILRATNGAPATDGGATDEPSAAVAGASEEAHGDARFAGAIAAYEAAMFPRAHAAMRRSAHGLVGHFSSAGGPERAALLRARAQQQVQEQ